MLQNNNNYMLNCSPLRYDVKCGLTGLSDFCQLRNHEKPIDDTFSMNRTEGKASNKSYFHG
jgi:hypothetical protein